MEFIGFAYIIFFVTTICSGYLQLLCDISLIYPIGLFVGICVTLAYLYVMNATKNIYMISGIGLIIIFFVATMTYDFSFDGQWYHMDAIKLLSNGWNFYYESEQVLNDSIWITCYAKATWIWGALLYCVTGNLQTAKSYHLLLMVANLFLIYPLIKNKYKYLIAILLVVNPVALGMIFSTYLDDVVYELGLSLILVYCYLRRNYTNSNILWLTMCMITCVLINIKFTALAYAGIIWFGVVVDCFNREKILLRNSIINGIVAIAVGIFLFGYNPYITNFVNYGHPFFPIQGENNLYKNVMAGTGAQGTFATQNRFEKLAQVTFSKCSNDVIKSPQDIEYKLPGFIYKDEARGLISVSARRSGFGIWFSLALVISFFALGYLLYKKNFQGIWVWTFLLIAISVAINPECWVARYVPQMAIIPVIVTIMLLQMEDIRANVMGKILAIVLVVNLCFLLLGSVAIQIRDEYRNYSLIKILQHVEMVDVYTDGFFNSTLETFFEKNNITYRIIDSKPTATAIKLPGAAHEHIAVDYVH